MKPFSPACIRLVWRIVPESVLVQFHRKRKREKENGSSDYIYTTHIKLWVLPGHWYCIPGPKPSSNRREKWVMARAAVHVDLGVKINMDILRCSRIIQLTSMCKPLYLGRTNPSAKTWSDRETWRADLHSGGKGLSYDTSWAECESSTWYGRGRANIIWSWVAGGITSQAMAWAALLRVVLDSPALSD